MIQAQLESGVTERLSLTERSDQCTPPCFPALMAAYAPDPEALITLYTGDILNKLRDTLWGQTDEYTEDLECKDPAGAQFAFKVDVQTDHPFPIHISRF